MTPWSPSKQAPWDLTQFSQSSLTAPLYFPDSHRWSEISSLFFKGDFSFGKMPEVSGHQIWAAGGLSHLGDLMFHQKNSARDMMHKWARCCDEAANHQLPIAAAFWIIQIVSVEEWSSLMQNLMQIHCSTQSFWMWQPHSTHAHSMVSTAPID